MATAMSQEAICSLVEYETLTLETEAGRKPNYNGVVLMDDMLLVVEGNDWSLHESYLHVYNRHDGKLITSHRLESGPRDVCLINKTEVAVCLGSTVVILSLKSRDDVKLIKTLQTGFVFCYSLVKWSSDKLVISGKKGSMNILCWGILSITDGRLDCTHNICRGYGWTRMAVRDDIVYISFWTPESFNTGVYAFNLPNKLKFLYQNQELEDPGPIVADRDCVYVCDRNRIHQLTDSGQLVTIHTVSLDPYSVLYDDHQGLIYTTSEYSNVITVYKMESLHQPDPGGPDQKGRAETSATKKSSFCILM